MKEWWRELAIREKQMIVLGSLVLIIILIYEIIWSPLHTANQNLRVKIQHQQNTLQYMQSADLQIQQLLKIMAQKNNKNVQTLLSTLQTAIKQSGFPQNVTQLRQAENDSVQIILSKVNFDQLIIFLNGLWQKQGLIVSQITVLPTHVPGEVSVDMMLSTS